MSRATRQTLILLLVAAALVAVVVYDRIRARDVATDPLLALEPGRPRIIELACAGCPPIRFEKHGARWRMVAPWTLPADPAAVARLVDIATVPALRRFDEGAVDPAAVGLAPSMATLRLDAHVLEFGTTDAIDNRRYVAVDGRIALVEDRFSTWLLSGPDRYASVRPLAGLRDPVAVAGSAWTDAQVALLRGVRALDVRPHELTPPAGAAKIGDAAGRALVYWWHPQATDLLLRADPPLAYTLPPEAAHALRSAAAP
jgi:hypothetical protein